MNTNFKHIVVIDARLINSSGIGTVIQNTVPYLIKYFKIILLGNPAELRKFAWTINCQVIQFDIPIYSIAEQVAFLSKVPECDYFFSPHYNIPLFKIKAKRRLVIIHDVNHIALGNDLTFIQRIYAKFVIARALKISDKVVTVSNFSKSEILKYFKTIKNQVSVIKLGLNTNIFKPYYAIHTRSIKDKYNLPDKFILYVGNVKPHKNLKALVKAFGLLKQNFAYKNYKLVIVGKKEGFITNDNELSSLISSLNLAADIFFTGYLSGDELPLLYNLASLFVFPSIYEGFGLPPIEAMACGCPTLVSNSSSLPEVCKDAAIFFNPLEPQEICKCMLDTLDNKDLQQLLKFKGFALANSYNWEITAKQLIQIIRDKK